MYLMEFSIREAPGDCNEVGQTFLSALSSRKADRNVCPTKHK
jgi:hypothetical protein